LVIINPYRGQTDSSHSTVTHAAGELSRTRLPGFATMTAHDYLVLRVFAGLGGPMILVSAAWKQKAHQLAESIT
jgi:hypothetical protein